METTFRLNAQELDVNFLEAIKKLFADKNIVISVAAEADTTEYLLNDPARKAVLLNSIQEAENGNLLDVNLNDYRTQ